MLSFQICAFSFCFFLFFFILEGHEGRNFSVLLYVLSASDDEFDDFRPSPNPRNLFAQLFWSSG